MHAVFALKNIFITELLIQYTTDILWSKRKHYIPCLKEQVTLMFKSHQNPPSPTYIIKESILSHPYFSFVLDGC